MEANRSPDRARYASVLSPSSARRVRRVPLRGRGTTKKRLLARGLSLVLARDRRTSSGSSERWRAQASAEKADDSSPGPGRGEADCRAQDLRPVVSAAASGFLECPSSLRRSPGTAPSACFARTRNESQTDPRADMKSDQGRPRRRGRMRRAAKQGLRAPPIAWNRPVRGDPTCQRRPSSSSTSRHSREAELPSPLPSPSPLPVLLVPATPPSHFADDSFVFQPSPPLLNPPSSSLASFSPSSLLVTQPRETWSPERLGSERQAELTLVRPWSTLVRRQSPSHESPWRSSTTDLLHPRT